VIYISSATKNALRSIRIKEDLDKLLQKDAEGKGISVNSLVSSILTRYSEWDRYAEKFGFVTITRDGFNTILKAADSEKLVSLGAELGSRNPKEMTQFWFKKLNLETFLAYLSAYCRYGKIAEYEVENSGRNYILTLHHHLGESYSTFLGHYMKQAVSDIVGAESELDIGKNSVVIKFTSN
jgi:hypothetical protein